MTSQLTSTLRDPQLLRHYINGEFVASDTRFPNLSPVDGRKLADVCEADAALVDSAVRAAHAAQKAGWRDTTPAQRAAWLHKIADGIEARFDEFVAAEVADTGRPVAQARTLDIARGIANFRTFADLVRTANGEYFETHTADGGELINYVTRKPLGVIGIISPWNLPLLLLTWKVAPALAMGNCVVAKPSEETPSSATLLAEVMHEVGLPPGVFNLIHGHGQNAAGEFLTRHPDISAITFTGESRTGSTIMKAVADGVKEVSFELGGKNAAVVFADADFDAAVAGVLRSSFTNAGQVCLCSERVYVERPIFERFVAALKEQAEGLRVGAPEDPTTTMGPLISRGHRDKVMSYFRLAVEEGATVVTGGRAPSFGDARDDGAFVMPTIWTGLPDSARCVREEIFGPVCHIAPFDDEEEVVKRVNDSAYGLAASIWTTQLARGHRVAKQIETGIVWVNAWFVRDLRTPFGGTKLSGLGREGGRHSLDFYSELTNVCVRIA
ncbi:2-hydroxymuconic semialdehyde dehydrogenase [Burkholderia multivorans]|uniref:2-hydroxymuconic semialdehyde dehydrogenase n=1 Tax=Burkholderia multivorans TaxID=87883 RepID=UPI00158A819F|nr:2-hydroxymuconic semialdehyde dehydrogenase [Burkholderia multivorans]MCA8481478.1 2-hydroxymuconic semialdehyde dehydrogenase [Burkholderia multivorans]MDR9053878.1 2-aminomuconic 6-semialdehyde dehydrogenase [Burkholderia multivorans]MDR9059837.1 2-aminomuconic 6-semialdehyde dehydrogenase [Burkholderia multivorans]MDR9065106.1 2-aminomuconic 6-semialdehyde dehydrogenase [Burkholderia multivorans]MDR9071681.1 2-aminomuconic 6-semialdehyde dehydrogenase [Burkholderia multivorans]